MAELGRDDERRNLVGIVIEFDASVGLGTIEGPDGQVSFHCIEIADGSRHDLALDVPAIRCHQSSA